MKRRVYIICQKRNWNKGTPRVLSDGFGKLEYVFASKDGLLKAKREIKEMNEDFSKNPVHIRKAILIIENEVLHEI